MKAHHSPSADTYEAPAVPLANTLVGMMPARAPAGTHLSSGNAPSVCGELPLTDVGHGLHQPRISPGHFNAQELVETVPRPGDDGDEGNKQNSPVNASSNAQPDP